MSDIKPGDECKCSHRRDQHTGKTETKKCTAKVYLFGKCDCVEFRPKNGPLNAQAAKSQPNG